jgi:C_GCAxxG_C_C family probable redox protein
LNDKMTPEEAVALALGYFADGYNCAQSVLQAVQAYHGIDGEELWTLATGLGAGISRQKSVCGALTGGVMACGLVAAQRLGSERENRWAIRDETYALVQELTQEFETRFGTTSCWEMTGCDFRTAEGKAEFNSRGLMDTVCRPAVRMAVEALLRP